MPNCFALTRKSNPEAGAVPLSKIDDEMCAFLGVPVHPKIYHAYWYDVIGFAVACGRTFDELRKRYSGKEEGRQPDPTDEQYLRIVDWLDANFTSDAWYAPK